jgi:pre-mRNA-splicing factor 18
VLERDFNIGTGGAVQEGGVGDEEEDKELIDAFASAAAAVAKQRLVDTMKPIDQVSAYLKMLLEEWEKELDGKTEDWIYSDLGRQTIANCRMCRNHLKPLFKRIKRRELPGDIERSLFLIVNAMKERNYRQVRLPRLNQPTNVRVMSLTLS